jgi:prephenate dehydrogenase
VIRRVSIIGSGQIGTSIALALVQTAPHIPISMTDIQAATLDLVKIKFQEAGLSSDRIVFQQSAKEAVAKEAVAKEAVDSNLVILATPISMFGPVIRDIKPVIKPGTIITDVGSAKMQAISTINEALSGTGIPYVPAHPGNGCQGNGPLSARAENILGPTSWMFLVHDKRKDAALSPAISAVRDFWKNVGVQVTETDPMTHDRFFGTCSHLQHAIAFSMMNMARHDEHLLNVFRSGGTIFRNLTRLAISPQKEGQSSALVHMWQPIFMQNKNMILNSARNFMTHFKSIVDLAANKDLDGLARVLEIAHNFRRNVHDPEQRENILGEIADIKASGSNLCQQFDQQALSKLHVNLLLPIVIANAQALNAHDVNADLVQGKANPSFRDGTAACLFNPDYAACLLTSHYEALQQSVSKFQESMTHFMGHLRKDNNEGIADFIQSAQDLRTPLPGARKGPSTRKQYLLLRDPLFALPEV